MKTSATSPLALASKAELTAAVEEARDAVGASFECVFRGTWAVISRDLEHAFHGISGSHFTVVGKLVDKVH